MAKKLEETESIITAILTSNPLRCTIKQLCDDFEDFEGYKIPFRQLGFTTVEDYLLSIPDTAKVYGSGMNALVEAVMKTKSAHVYQMVLKNKTDSIPSDKMRLLRRSNTEFQQGPSSLGACDTTYEYQSKVPKGIQNNMRKLILKFPQGILCTELPVEYNKMFDEKLSFVRHGYRSLMEMCSDLPDILHYVQHTPSDFILYDRNKPIPSLGQNEQLSPPSCAMDPSLIPSDIVPLGDRIPSLRLDQFKVKQTMYVLIGEIYDLTKFCMYLPSKEFRSLTKEMQKFFQSQRNKYKIPDVLLRPGLYCVCFHTEEYHRTIIIGLVPELRGFVKVFFIDCGSVGNVPISDIFYLPKQFGEMPSQGIRTKLWNLTPSNDKQEWGSAAIDHFTQRVTNTVLLAEIMSIDLEKNVLGIYLADVTDENNVFYINDRLVEHGYASYIKRTSDEQ